MDDPSAVHQLADPDGEGKRITTPVEWQSFARRDAATQPRNVKGRDRRHPAMRLLPTLLGLLLACAICGGIASVAGLEVGAPVFVVFVLTLAAVRPSLIFTLALMLAPFPNDISVGLPVRIAASDLCLFLALPFVFARRHAHFTRALRTPYWMPVTAYLGLCVASTVLHGMDHEAVVSTSQMFIYMVFTALMFAAGSGAAEEALSRLYAFVFVSIIIAGTIVIGGSNYVLGLHKNSAGSTLAAATLIALGLSLNEAQRGRTSRLTIALLAACALGLLASLSRGAWIGAAAGSVLIMMLFGRIAHAVRLAVFAVPLMAVLWLVLPEAQRDYATDLSSGAHNIQARLLMIDYAMDRFRESPIIGVGVGLRKTYDATNVALSTLAETGILGLASFAAIYATLGMMTFSAARRMDRRDPAFALLAIGIALVLAKLLHGMVDHYWGRGAILFWAGAGFVIFGFIQSRGGRNSIRL